MFNRRSELRNPRTFTAFYVGLWTFLIMLRVASMQILPSIHQLEYSKSWQDIPLRKMLNLSS